MVLNGVAAIVATVLSVGGICPGVAAGPPINLNLPATKCEFKWLEAHPKFAAYSVLGAWGNVATDKYPHWWRVELNEYLKC